MHIGAIPYTYIMNNWASLVYNEAPQGETMTAYRKGQDLFFKNLYVKVTITDKGLVTAPDTYQYQKCTWRLMLLEVTGKPNITDWSVQNWLGNASPNWSLFETENKNNKHRMTRILWEKYIDLRKYPTQNWVHIVKTYKFKLNKLVTYYGDHMNEYEKVFVWFMQTDQAIAGWTAANYCTFAFRLSAQDSGGGESATYNFPTGN